jgi:uridylate kinase
MKAYERVLLKLSGEALAGEKKTGFDEVTCIAVAKQVRTLIEEGIQVSIVIGGGNFWRGRTSETIDRTKADQIGMLATVMNCIYVSEIFRHVGMKTEVFTPFACGSMSTLFSKDSVIACMKQGGVSFLAGGTGHPYFSTDTTAALRAAEIEADVILMAKNNVDGVYSADPRLDSSATKYDELSYLDVIKEGLAVMDSTASSLCMDNDIPLIVFSIMEQGNIKRVVLGEKIGTIVRGKK